MLMKRIQLYELVAFLWNAKTLEVRIWNEIKCFQIITTLCLTE